MLNSATYLPQTLQSIASQTHDHWEHIIVDSGSTDGSLDLVRDWCERDPRARLVTNDGLGLYPSVLQGFSEAKGTLLGWLNADDLYTPWALDLAWKAHSERNAEWLTGFPSGWDSAGTLRFVRPYGWYPTRLIRNGWFHEQLLGFLQQESIFFSRPLFERLGDDDREAVANCRLAGDFVLWTRFARLARLDVVPSVLSGFRLHGGNLSSGNLDAYLEEVRAHGGTFLPGPFRGLARRLFRAISALTALRSVERADSALHAELSSSTSELRSD